MLQKMLEYGKVRLRPKVAHTLVALPVVVAAYFVHAAWTGDDEPLEGTWICMTRECGCQVHRVPTLGEVVPEQCPKCSKRTLVPGYACPKCKRCLVLNVYRGLEQPTICPNCEAEVWYGQ